MTEEAKELCTGKAAFDEPCCRPKGHVVPCFSTSWWCTKHDFVRLYENRPCVECLTERLDRLEGLSEPRAKAEDAAQVSELVPLHFKMGTKSVDVAWVRYDEVCLVSEVEGQTRVCLGRDFKHEVYVTETVHEVLERIGKAKGADPLFAATLLNALRKEGAQLHPKPDLAEVSQ